MAVIETCDKIALAQYHRHVLVGEQVCFVVAIERKH